MKTWTLYDGGFIENVGTVEAENEADALTAMCEMLNSENEVFNFVVDDNEIYQYEGEIQNGDEPVRVYNVEALEYTVENYDGFTIGKYTTKGEAIEAAKKEWKAQHDACTNDDEMDPSIADDEWIFIESDAGDYGYVTRGGAFHVYGRQ